MLSADVISSLDCRSPGYFALPRTLFCHFCWLIGFSQLIGGPCVFLVLLLRVCTQVAGIPGRNRSFPFLAVLIRKIYLGVVILSLCSVDFQGRLLEQTMLASIALSVIWTCLHGRNLGRKDAYWSNGFPCGGDPHAQ